MRDLKVVILGCGRHGERYLRHLQRGDVPGVRVGCIQRRSEVQGRALAERYAVPWVETEEEALTQDGVDAVIVATPPGSHLQSLESCATRGLPVLCEKPVGRVEDLEGLLRLSAAPIMVAQTLRWHPTLVHLRERREALGRVHRQRWCQRLEPCDLPWQRDRDASGGGSILLTGVHLFDQLRWWWQRTPDAVTAEALAVEGHPLENLFAATFVFEEEQRLVSVEVTKCSRSRVSFVETVGLQGQVWADYEAGRARQFGPDGSEDMAVPPNGPTLPSTVAAFAEFVRGEGPNPVPLRDGIETLRMAEACYRSHRLGRRVQLGEISPKVR